MSASNPVPRVPDYRPPMPNLRRAGTFGMMLFIGSLAMLFGAAILGYLFIRTQWINPDIGPTPPLGTIHMPMLLWLSTAIVVMSSATFHYAGISVAMERQIPFRHGIFATCLLGFAFLIVQVPALYQLLDQQRALADVNNRLYLLIFTLVILHALHVIGGIIPLVVITRKAYKGAYDHEHHHPVTHMALYWHFLGAAWILMFSMMQILG